MIKKLMRKIRRLGKKGYYKLKGKIAGAKYTCPFCKMSFNKLLPAGHEFEVLKKKKVIGGGYRENAKCPLCYSSDRDRLVYLFLQNRELLKPGMKLLHVGPSKSLKRYLQDQVKYTSIGFKDTERKMDVQEMSFDSHSFDAIICNHVLEHVKDDKRAMRELYRVLKPEGWAILQVPYTPISKTVEGGAVTEQEKEKKFGQKDHLRLYGTDYPERLRSAGFKVKREKLGEEDVRKYALNERERVFWCGKQWERGSE